MSYVFNGPYGVAFHNMRNTMLREGFIVDTGQWQSQSDVPMTATRELMYVNLEVFVNLTIEAWADQVMPNLPWAEEHFQERVSGYAWNPPPSAERWPFAQAGHADHTDSSGRFSHTYPERLWPYGHNPQAAGTSRSFNLMQGGDVDYLVGTFGGLDDLVKLLSKQRHTRQAFIPIWWPCDGAMAGYERVPCTIGYHFLIRGDRLYCHYYMRSCDMYRHLADDVYMAGRLMQWIGGQVGAIPGTLHMAVSSMHVFEGDIEAMKAGLR